MEDTGKLKLNASGERSLACGLSVGATAIGIIFDCPNTLKCTEYAWQERNVENECGRQRNGRQLLIK